jgi:hypothetical protein
LIDEGSSTSISIPKNKLPGGLVMKDVNPGYEMVRTGSAYHPLQSTANMLGALGFPPVGGYPTMLPPNINPTQFIQQSKIIILCHGTELFLVMTNFINLKKNE